MKTGETIAPEHDAGRSRFQTQMKIEREDIAPGLVELGNSSLESQAAFWKSCVERKQPELKEVGGLPDDRVMNDVLTRYFDSSQRGLHKIYKAAVRDQAVKSDSLDKDGLYDALSQHLMFFDPLSDSDKVILAKDGSSEAFERICKKTGIPCSLRSFSYVVRHLRKALLLDHFGLGSAAAKEACNIYHCDFDDDFIHTPFEKSVDRRPVHHGRFKFQIPVVSKQVPIASFADYLFTSKKSWKGRVHWSHLPSPSMELLLSVGQVWRLPGPTLTTLCELNRAQPQISYMDPKHCTQEDSDGYAWSLMILPAIHLDHASRKSLDVYRQWFENVQDPKVGKSVKSEPPRIHVAVTHTTLAMMWSFQEANSLVTTETEGIYIGRWTTDTDDHKPSFFTKLLDRLTCAGACVSRDRPDGYQKLPTDDPEEGPEDAKCSVCGETHMLAGISIDHDLHQALESDGGAEFSGLKATDPEVSCVTFEQNFHQVLQALESQNSMLRLGDHYHLLTRIVLNRTTDYMDVLGVYEAAIKRLTYLLQDDATDKKDVLIAKIETLKLELIALERVVKPFGEFVVPDLLNFAQTIKHEYPLVFHHIKDIQNNIRAFIPKCKYLISRCETKSDEYDRMAQANMDNILNILTFITFVITPMQLMTGIYGMNFRIMPELNWKHGYLGYWWGLCTTLTFVFALILICLKRK